MSQSPFAERDVSASTTAFAPAVTHATPAEDALVTRGARHVQVGLALGAVGTLALLAVAVTGGGAGMAIGIGGWIGALLTQASLAAALLSGSRIARGLLAVSGVVNFVVAGSMALLGTFGPANGLTFDLSPLPLAAAMATVASGNVLASLTGPARGWFRARRAMFASRRKAKSLAEWRSGSRG